MPFSLGKYVILEINKIGDRIYSPLATLWDILIEFTHEPELGTLYCALDALGECEDASRNQFLRQISKHFSSSLTGKARLKRRTNLKLIITDRPYETLQHHLHRFAVIHLKAEEEKSINSDIALFVIDGTQHLASLRHYTPALSQRVRVALLTGADGMFLWAALMIEMLESTPVGKVERKLKELRKGVDGIYNQVPRQIPEGVEDEADNILKWVVFAARPLMLKELGIACAVRPEYKSA